MSYTPGPWKVDRPYIRGAGRVIASLESGRNEVEDAANAPLIAAAPELYEMLKEALINIERVTRGGIKTAPFLAEWVREARATLAKARGEEGEDGC